ncbi:MAG: hypothetical protein H0U59_06130 [Gemmatimonadaceae bacterium]|nr:hypothetical protein [Gemmatimonadaceae bacterium]
MSETVSEDTLRRLVFQGYQIDPKQKQTVAEEIARSRAAFARAKGAPADVCLCHDSVATALPSEEGFLVLGEHYVAPTVWYLGVLGSAS